MQVCLSQSMTTASVWSMARAGWKTTGTCILIINLLMGLGLQRCCAPNLNAQEERELSKISESYLGDIADFSNLSHEVPHYQNITHCCLVNKLMRYRLQFTDQLYPCTILLNEASWKRITTLYSDPKFGAPNFYLKFQDEKKQSPFSSRTFVSAMEKLKRFPELVARIFPNHQVSPVGFYVLYFCTNGSVGLQQRREIVVDDYIPIDSYGEYLGSRVCEGTGIWPILVEKALAKCLGSYHIIDYLTADQIFSEISGVPVPDQYRSNDCLISSFHEFGPQESKYIRVGISQETQLLMAIWESSSEIDGRLSSINLSVMRSQGNQKFIVDIIPESPSEDYLQQKLALRRLGNKLIICQEKGEMLKCPRGRYVIHIFNRSLEKVACNFVIHSNLEIGSPTEIFGPSNQMSKHLLLKRMYQRVHLSRAVVYEQLGIALRMAWFGPRAILCLKNETEGPKIVCVEIISSSIFFEDKKGELKVEELIQSTHHKVFILLLRSDQKCQQFGQFYRIHTRTPS